MKNKILIIDAFSAYISFIQRILTDEGYDIFVCENENEIYSFLETYIPDIILIDVLLSNSKGFEILTQLKLKYFLTAPIIIISEDKNIETIEMAFKSGVYDYLIKPINIKDLINKITNALKTENKNEYHV